jgi:hypothetical protein
LATITLLAIITLGCPESAFAGFITTPAGLCYVNDVEATTYYTPGDVIATHCGIRYKNTTEVVQFVWVNVEILHESGNLIVDGGETIEFETPG